MASILLPYPDKTVSARDDNHKLAGEYADSYLFETLNPIDTAYMGLRW
jgi:hypothetical protein